MTCVEGSTTAGIANWVQCTSLTVPKPNYNLTGKPSAKRFNNGDLKKSFDTNQSSFDSYYSGYFVNDADKYSELNDGWWVANWQTEITLIQNPFHVIRPVGTQATLETVAYGPSLKYQWYVATSATGTGTQIDSATNSTYAATVQSANRWYYCVISGTDSKGVAMSKTSARALVGPGETPVIDDTPPTGTISASTTCTNQNSVTLYVKAQDAISGVNNVNIVAWTGGEAYDKTCSTKAATYNSTKQQWEVTYTFTEIKNTTTGATNQGDNSYYFKGHIFDGAGNRAVTSAATVMYDTTAPTYGSYTVTGTTLTNGIRYAPSSTSEITLKFTALSDNLSGVKNIDAYMKKDGATRSNAYTVSSSISGTTGEVRFKLNGYGTYVTEMYLYDKAGNSKVLPAITIEVEQGDPLPKLMERDMYNYDDPEPSMIGARRADENTTYLAEKVLHIRFINLNESSEPTNYEATWDASYNDGEGEVTAWVVQSYEDSSMYDLIIGADDIIQAPKNSECLFAYYENCKSIEGLENLSTSNVTTMSHMFDGCGILGLNLNYFDTTNVQSMSCMFLNCQDIVELDLGSFNTSAVTDMSSMFCECRSLEYVNVSSFDTSKVTNMFSMFKCCYLLEDINITNFDTSLVVNIQEMFRQCSSLETVDLSHFATGYVQRMDYLFQDCTSLKYIDLSTQNFSAADPSTGMFQGCGNLESIKIGPIFCTLNWKYAFEDCTSLKAIISTSESPLFLVTTGNLQSLPNAILYVPSTTAEAAYEAADNYDTVFGADRVRPILELVGDSTVKVFTGSTYKDAGITVAGMDKDTVNSTYTPYGYTVSGPVIKKNGTVVSSIDTSTAGNTYTYTYTIKDSTNTEGMSVTRTVTVANPGRLMARESGISGTESYAIGAKRAGKTQYTADKIKTITLQGNLTAPKGYVDTWDVSENQDGSLAAWVVKNSEDSTMYDLYIGGNNEIKAPTAGYMLFAFYTKCTKINNLNLLNTSSTTGMRGFFYRLYELESLDLSNFSTASCTNTWDMFSDCKALTTLDVSNFDTSKLNYATYMFYGCMNVTNINLGNFVTTNVTSTSGMFYNCQKLTSVDVSTFDTSKVTNMSRMFSNCYALKNLNLKNFDTSKVTNMSFMFSSTTSLLNLDLSSFNTTSVTNMDSMLFNSSNLLSLLIGNNFDKLTGASMFRSCSKLKRIITPRTSISTLNADSTTTTGLKTLTNVILYVPTLDAETTYESNAAYSDIFGSARIKPILELIGNNPRTIYQNMPYTDDGVTVAELYKNLDDTYTPFGYTVSGPVIRKNGTIVSEVDTSTLETYTLTYTVIDPSGVSGMSVTRTLTPGSKPVLMARDSDANGYYAIGAVRTAYDIADDMYLDYRADTIKTITLVDLSTTAAPTNYEATWDAGYDYGSNAVIAYIKANAEDSTMYDLYLCSYGTMYAPADSKTLFAYYTNCTNINNLELLDTSDATTMRGFFYKMESLQSVELSEFSTTNCTNMWDMFNNCKSLTSISVSSFDTSNLIYATWMFYGCSNVTNINLAGIDTTNVKSMSGMFYNCSKLASLDLSSFNTANVTDMGTMFRNCSTLKSLDLTSFNTSSVTNMDQMFSTCSNLTSMKLGANFDKLIGATMFTGCSNLKAIITPRTTILTLNDDTTTNTGLKTLANAILYVPSTTAETTFEAATSYADIFGASRIKPILELIGDNPVKASNGVTYVDSGVTVAGMTKNADGTTYTPYGYTVSGPVIKKDGTVVSNIDTSTKGTYTYTYTVKDSANAEGMSVTRAVNVAEPPTLMERDSKYDSSTYKRTYYAIGSYERLGIETYTADKIKKITLIDLSKESVPTTYVATWDASYTNGDGDVTAWLVTNAEDSTMYDLYLGAEGKIYAPSNSDYLFCYYSNCVEINGLNNLDTSNVTNMSYMFSVCSSLTSLDVSNFNTSNVTNMNNMFWYCSKLTNLDVSNFKTSNVTSMKSMFAVCSRLTNLDVSNFDTSNVTNMRNMFIECGKIISLDVSNFNTSNVTDMGEMFGYDYQLTNLDTSNFDTSNVTDMTHMFYGCGSLTNLDVSGFDTGNVTNMTSMFDGCSGLTILDVSGFDTSNATGMSSMFSRCSGLTNLDVSGFDTSKVTGMGSMFNECRGLTSLDVSKFDTSNVTGSMMYMFSNCGNLTVLDVSNFNTSQVTTMYGMFMNCGKLTNLDVSNFDTSKVRDMQWMFHRCSSLKNLDVSGFDTSNATNMSGMFGGCSSLTNLDVSNFNTSKVTDMDTMFASCSSLTNLDVSGFNTSKVTDIRSMFHSCSSLTSLDLSNFDVSNAKDVDGMFYECNNLLSLKLGQNFDKLTGTYLFVRCSNLKAIITSRTTIMTLDDNTSLKTLTNAILYVPSTTAEATFEADANYADIFGADRIKPILELVGDNPAKVPAGSTYVDAGVTVAGVEKNADGTTYTPYGYTVSGPLIKKDGTVVSNIDTSTKGTYTYTYTIKDSANVEGMGVTRDVIVKGDPILMVRDSKYDSSTYRDTYYAIGSYKRLGVETYTANKIKTITLIDLNTTATPTNCVATWDASYTNGDGDVTAWLVTNAEDNTMYDLYLGAEGKIFAPNNSKYLFGNYNNCVKINGLNNLETSNVTNMSYMFYSCSSLTSLNVINFNTSKVTDMSLMFYGCSRLTNLDVSNFDTSNVTSMRAMFSGCSSLTSLDVSNFNTSNVTNMGSMFSSCSNLTNLDVSNFDTSNVTNMESMFSSCSNLTNLDVSNFDTSKVTDMSAMFGYCSFKDLDLSNIDTSNVTDMHWMFYGCTSLTSLDVSNFNTSNVTSMDYMFYLCKSLTSLDVSSFDTNKIVKKMSQMFYGCNGLTSLKLGENFDKLIGSNMFTGCSNLKAIITPRTTIMTLNSGSSIPVLAVLYVPSTTAEATFEADANYADIFGADRIRPILELVGENPVKVSKGATYVDSGVTVAGMTKNADGTTYTPYSYTVSGPVIKKDGTVVTSIDTSAKGTYTYTYTIKDSANVEGMSVTRDVIVKDNPTLMRREDANSSNGYKYYAIGAYRADKTTTYTAAKIKTINIIDLNTTSAPASYEATWDASYTNGDNTVTAWLVTNAEDTTLYDLYLGAEGKIYAPSSSQHLFGDYSKCTEINGLANLDTSKVTNMSGMFFNCSSLPSLEVSNFDTSKVMDMGDMFYQCRSLPSLDVSNFDTSKVTYMGLMFHYCSSLTSLDVSNFDTSKVTNMSDMFSYCSSLTSLDVSNFNTSNVTNMRSMFYNCRRLTSLEVSSFDTSRVTNMSWMFAGCSSLPSLEVSSFNTSNVTSMYCMFNSCGSLTDLDVTGFDTSKVTDMSYMFPGCSGLTNLDVSGFNTSNVTNMSCMFNLCEKLTSLDVSTFDTSKVTNMYCMFSDCSSLTSLDVSNFDTSNVTNMGRMFYSCGSLTSLDISNFDTSKVTNVEYMFYRCSLTSLKFGQNFDKLTGANMFSGCSDLKAIITPRTTIMTLNDNTTTSIGLNLNAILYVPSATAEATFEADANYADIFGADRIRPILELIGDNPVKVSKGATYVDSGVTVAGMTKNADGTTYTPYGYTVSGPVIKKDDTVVSSVDTSNVGTYTLTYTVHEPNSSVDGMSVTREVEIESKDISENNPDITVSIPTEDRVYKDAEYRPVVTIKDNAKTLVKNTDYTVSYSNNISAGMATITIKGINNYTGTRTINFIITQRAVTIKPKDASKVYDTLPLTSNVAEVTAGDLVTGHIATITTTGSITEVGSITNTISTLIIKNASGTDVTSNYDITKGVGTLTVTAADNVDFDITLDNNTFVYDGTEKEPGVTIKVNGVTLEEGKDYDVSYKNNIKAGTATVTIKGKGNYEGSSSTKDFTITVRLLEITAGSASKVYNGTALTSSAFSITSGTSLAPNQTLSVTTSGTITNVGTTSNVIATYNIYHNAENVTANYSVTLKEGILEVKPATITGSVIITGTNRVGKTLTAEVTVNPSDASLTYAWYYGTTNDINNATAITGVNTKTYSPTTDKIGMYIFVKVTASKENYNDATFTDITDNENNKVEKVGDRLTPYLMAREVQTVTSNGVTSEKAGYAIGAYRAGKTKYTSDLIKSVTIINLLETNAPTTYEAMWDASRDEDEAVYAWAVKNQTNSSMYDLYIGGEGTLVLTNGKRLFADYTKCEEINGLNKMNSTNVTDMSYMFSNLASMNTLDVSVVNTSSVTNMEGMFMTNNLTTLNVSGFDTGKVTNMSKMFKESSNLTSININGFNTSNTNNMSQMFMDCGNITSLNVSAFNTSNVTNMSAMFMGMSKLETLNVTNFNTANVTDMSSMFASCLKVQRLDLHTFNTTKVTNISGMFTADSSMKSVLLGEEFNKLNGSNMFTGCSSLKAIIAQKKITASSEAMTLSATGTGLNTLTNATLYVPNLESKGYYETATNYATVFGEARVKPILEIIGSNPVHVTVGTEYEDEGATVAGFGEAEASEYTVYGYTLSVSGLPVDTSTAGTRLVIYTVKYKDQIVVTGATW